MPSARHERRVLRAALQRLRPRKQAIVKRHYGIDGTPETLVEIASDLHLVPRADTRPQRRGAARAGCRSDSGGRRLTRRRGSVVPPPGRAANRRTASTGVAEDRGDKEVRDGSNCEPDAPRGRAADLHAHPRRRRRLPASARSGTPSGAAAGRRRAADAARGLGHRPRRRAAPAAGSPTTSTRTSSARPRRRGCVRRPSTSRPTPPRSPSSCAARPWPRCSRRSSATKTH